ncbi:hypothetical protein O181_009424 [Austropuccinia psidii MF-1]|uniref:SPX domain-containing protein n=1 Tax=Austropuccinia psidii MF-1 TaxID=1389203 RepID=A0A9Q3BPA6_9BASI|nr:hypothetical protein [Austropuccinia psidii MF-1]
MKFSNSLLFSIVPEWQSHYVSYDSLKLKIYKFEQELNFLNNQKNLKISKKHLNQENQSASDLDQDQDNDENEDQDDQIHSNEITNLIKQQNHHHQNFNLTFLNLLSIELKKVHNFFNLKEFELIEEVENLIKEIQKIESNEFQSIISELESHSSINTNQVHSNNHDDSNQPRPSSQSFKRQLLYKSAIKFGILPILGFNKQAKKPNTPLIDLNNPSGESVNIFSSKTSNPINKIQPNQPRQSTSKPLIYSPKNRQRSLSIEYATNSSNFDLSNFWMSNIELVHDSRVFFKRRLTQTFVNLNSLNSFIDLNFTAFRKILKKYDKVFQTSLSAEFLQNQVLTAKCFEPSTKLKIQSQIDALYVVYARVVTQGDQSMAKKQLAAHLREQIVWERNTIWRDMIGLERKGWVTDSNKSLMIDKPFARETNTNLDQTNEELLPITNRPLLMNQAFKGLCQPKLWMKWLMNRSVFWSIVAFMASILATRLSTFKSEPEKNCLTLLVFVVILWTTEALPLFVTGMFVPLLAVTLRVIRDPSQNNQRMDASNAALYIFGQMLSPTIILLLGAFTLAAVLSKHNIDKVMASKLLGFAGTKPRSVLLAYMAVTCFASMWISNVAAPVLSYSLSQPILRTIPTRSPFTRSLILGIALAADIGGQASPIASPQNLIALSYMNPPPSWLAWFSISIPVSVLSILTTWLILTWAYEREFEYENYPIDPELEHLAPQTQINQPIVYIKPIPSTKEPFSIHQWFILVVGLLTVGLWCIEKRIEGLFGDMGVIGLIPIIVYFGTGSLRKADFDNFPWSIVFLAMSGIALGKSVLSSGLLNDMDLIIESLLEGLSLWPIALIFGVISLVISTFISHTVASVLLIPIAKGIGMKMSGGVDHSRILIMITTLICSTGMGLPVSSFPNQTAINLEDELGLRYLKANDFLKFGLLSSLISSLNLLTLGYLIMLIIL